MKRKCNKCKKEKDVSSFYPCKTNGYQYTCKDCMILRNKKKIILPGLLEDEKWDFVAGCNGRYSISSMGRIKTNDYTDCVGKFIKGRLFSGYKDKKGYLYYEIRYMDAKKMVKIHRLVAAAFIPNPNNLPQINHINGIKTDNRIVNLEWASPKENMNHARKLGLDKQFGETHSRATLKDSQVLFIFNSTDSISKLMKEFNASYDTIYGIKRQITWKHLTKKTNL